MKIKKASGELVDFDESKLIQSLMRSGANKAQSQEVLEEVQKLLVDGMSTHKIYSKAYKLLRQYSAQFAAKYHLKQGVLQLGPSGYPFEQLTGHILRAKGYKTKTNVYMEGKCVQHEVDAYCLKDNDHVVIECKYKNTQGLKSDVKVPLYIHSRVEDIKQGELKGKKVKGWIVTNTEFSEDALKFAKCSGLHLISWKYPSKGNLRDLIEETGAFPLTCLSTLTRKDKERLLAKKVLMLKTLVDQPNLLEEIDLSSQRIDKVLAEAKTLTDNYV